LGLAKIISGTSSTVGMMHRAGRRKHRDRAAKKGKWEEINSMADEEQAKAVEQMLLVVQPVLHDE
jgi:hypothetical protein